MTAPRWQSNLLYDFRRNIYSWTLKLPHYWGKASTDTQQTLVIRMQHGKTSGPFLLLRFSHVQLFANPWTAAHQASLSCNICWSLLKLLFIESVMPSNHLVLYHPLLFLPSIFSSISIFSNESFLCIRWPKYWSFSFSISPSNEYSGLISFKIDYFDPLAVLGTLKNLLRHHSSKASILRHSAFFMAQLSHPYMTTGKTIALTR